MAINSLKKYYFSQHLSVFFLGFTGIIGKLVSQHPFVIILFRTFFAFLSISLFLNKANRVKIFQFTKKDHALFLLTAVILVAHWFAFFLGIQKSNASIGTLAFSIFPLFLTVLEPLFFAIPYSFFRSIMCLFLLVGIFLLSPSISFSSQIFVGICWGIVSGFFMALFILMNRFLSPRFPIKEISFFQSFYSTLIACPFALLLLPWHISFRELVLLFCLGTFCTGLAHILSLFSLKKISAQHFGVINALESVYAVIFSFFLLGERLTLKGYLGAIIILSSFLIFSLQKNNGKQKQLVTN